MNIKTLYVFYGGDFLPYKDKEREVHYPNVGSDFQGAENITTIRFYIGEIASNNTTFAVAIELPNGKIGSKVLSPAQYDSELGEYYVTLAIDSFITQKAGNVSISLRGYQGDIELKYDDDSQLYVLVGGTPITAVTGSIKLRVNQEPQALQGDLDEEVTLQEVLALLSTKLNITDGIFVVQDITQANISGLDNGQLIYSKNTDSVYKRNTSAQSGYEKLYDIASKSWVVSNYVPYTGATGNVDLNGYYIYNANVDTDYTGENHDTYKSNNYKQISNVAFVLKQNTEIENNKINAEMYEYFLNENATLLCGGLLYRKLTETASDLIYACLNASITTITDGTSVTLGKVVSISKTEISGVHFYTESDLTLDLYSKEQAKAKFGTSLALELNNTNYKLVAKLYNANGGLINTSNEIDFPLESIVSSATYYDTYTYEGVTYTKVIVITLSTTSVPTIVPVGDLISGLEKEACVEVEASSSSGTFTEEEMQTLALDNASIKWGGRIFHKVTNTNFSSIDVTIGQGLNLVVSNAISITASTREWEFVTKVIQVYNKDEIDTIVQGLQGDIDTNAHDIDTLEGDVSDIQGDIEDIDERLDNHDTDIAKLKKDVDYAMKYPLLYGTPTTDTEEEVGLTTSQLPATTLPKGLINYVGGSSFAVNQQFSNSDFSNGTNGWEIINNATLSVTDGVARVTATENDDIALKHLSTPATIENHKYFVRAKVRTSSPSVSVLLSTVFVGAEPHTNSQDFDYLDMISYSNSSYPVGTAYPQLLVKNASIDDWFEVQEFFRVDLTKMFGSGNEPTTTSDPRIQWLLGYLAENPQYDEGSIVNAPVENIVSKGFNQWDEEWEVGEVNGTTGAKANTGSYIRSENFISVLPNTTYYAKSTETITIYQYESNGDYIGALYGKTNDTFTTASNCYKLLIATASGGTTYNHDICINLSGAMNGTYKPYQAPINYPIPAEVQALDGYGLGINTTFNTTDLENKKFVKKVAKVDMGTLDYTINEGVFMTEIDGMKPGMGVAIEEHNVLSPLYSYDYNLSSDMTMGLSTAPTTRIWFRNDAFNQDTASFKSAMSGVYLIFELETPVETDISEYLDRDFPNENLIDLYQGGEVEFENESDMGVPYSLTYQYKVE